MAIEIISAGPLTTVQDIGRVGMSALGYPESGACDKYAFRTANLLVGNSLEAPGDAALECTLSGITAYFTSPSLIAFTGADMQPALNGRRIPMYTPILVSSGDMLVMGAAVSGLRSYIAFRGGIDVPVRSGSRSTDLKCKIGGYLGRQLRDRDILEIIDSSETRKITAEKLARMSRFALETETAWLRGQSRAYRFYGSKPVPLIRVVLGPQDEAFPDEALRVFSQSIFTLSADSNRMAAKLEGPVIETVRGSDILSDGIVEGSIQVSSNGKPIAMLADHQTAGGYAKIATIIRVDIPVLAQLKPGDEVAFSPVTPEIGIHAYRDAEKQLAKWKEIWK